MLDFGAGTGAVLSTLGVASRRLAVEYSEAARRYMHEHAPGLEVFQYPEEVAERSVDLVFSTSVIEHVYATSAIKPVCGEGIGWAWACARAG